MITLFSIFLSLYVSKISGFFANLQWRLRQRPITSFFSKALSCTACLGFWTSLTTCFCYNLTWDVYVLTAVSSYVGGGFVEKVWMKL